MEIKPTLLILAAGMGSRYGGLKQLDGIGPNGETIMDYSVFDAIRCGFGKIVFVIRRDFEDDFRKTILSKYENKIKTEVVFQQIDKLPAGFTANPDRVKPWGTNHAVLMAKDAIREPFAVINADDFYGYDSFKVLSKALYDMIGTENNYCMVGFHVGNTLSEGGTVSRGVCSTNEDHQLTTVEEHHGIERKNGVVCFENPDGKTGEIDENTVVSMNMWGFTPDYFDYSEKEFIEFLTNNKDQLKGEFYIPSMVNKLINDKIATVKVHETQSSWFGVTYSQDRENVVNNIKKLIEDGTYPESIK